MVSAAELRTDGGKGHLCDLADNVDSYLTGSRDLCGALAGAQILGRYAVYCGYLGDDLLNGDGNRLLVCEDVAHNALSHGNSDGASCKVVESLQADNCALKLTDVGSQAVSHEFRDLAGHFQLKKLGFSVDDSKSCFVIGGRYICDETALETGAQTLLESYQLLGGLI